MSCSRSWSMLNSDRSWEKLTEQTKIQVRVNVVQHTQCNNMTSMKQWQESLIRAKPGARLAEDDIQQQTPTPGNKTQGLREQMHSSNEATMRCLQRQCSSQAPTSINCSVQRVVWHERIYNLGLWPDISFSIIFYFCAEIPMRCAFSVQIEIFC